MLITDRSRVNERAPTSTRLAAAGGLYEADVVPCAATLGILNVVPTGVRIESFFSEVIRMRCVEGRLSGRRVSILSVVVIRFKRIPTTCQGAQGGGRGSAAAGRLGLGRG